MKIRIQYVRTSCPHKCGREVWMQNDSYTIEKDKEERGIKGRREKNKNQTYQNSQEPKFIFESRISKLF